MADSIKTVDSIGARIASVRGSSTQMEFAKRYGIHKNTLARYERNERSPDAEFLSALASAGHDPYWLLLGVERGDDIQVRESSANYRNSIDWVRLEEIIGVIEELAARGSRSISTALKARLICQLYRYYSERCGPEGQISRPERDMLTEMIMTALDVHS